MADYYRSSWHGMPTAAIMYELAQSLHRDNNDLLWCALPRPLWCHRRVHALKGGACRCRLCLVGLHDQFVNGQIDEDEFDKLVEKYGSDVRKFNELPDEQPEPSATRPEEEDAPLAPVRAIAAEEE